MSILFIAIRMLTGDRPKFIGLVFGLAFATFLMAQQLGIFTGFMRQCGVWVREVSAQGVDVWVVDPETEMVDDLKQMRNGELERVRSIPGVAWAVPMYKNYAQARLPDGSMYLIRVIGVDDSTLIGAPRMKDGSVADLRQDQAVFINAESDPRTSLMMKKSKNPRELRVGDRMDINDNAMRVMGAYTKEKEFFWGSAVYTTFRRAQAIMPPTRKMTTFVLVHAKPGVAPEDLAKRIRNETRLGAFTSAEMEDKTMMFVLLKTGILLGVILCVAGAGFLSFWRIRKIEPAIVFRS